MKLEYIRIMRLISVIFMFISLFLPILAVDMMLEWGKRKPANADDYFLINMFDFAFFESQFKLVQFDFVSNSFDVIRVRSINNFISFFQSIMLLAALVGMIAMILKEIKHDKINQKIIDRSIYISNTFFIILMTVLIFLKLIIRIFFDVGIDRFGNIEYLMRSEGYELYFSFIINFNFGFYTLLISSLLALYSQVVKSDDYINFS